MAEAALMGWDADAQVWRKLVCNAAGKLIIDPSEILEDAPTDGEVGKGPTSNWAFDHNANASAHHAKYTDAEARTAIGDLFDSTGKVLEAMNVNYKNFNNVYTFTLKNSAVSTHQVLCATLLNQGVFLILANQTGKGYVPAYFKIHNGTTYETVVVVPVMDTAILTHKNIADAHHAKYTDAEAVAAVGLNGTKYWSCAGIHFDAVTPSTDNISKSIYGGLEINVNGISLTAQVLLPHGAVVTSAIVRGNTPGVGGTWLLHRYTLSDKSLVTMAGTDFNAADSTISYATIDNSAYAYFLSTSALYDADEIYGALITYTI